MQNLADAGSVCGVSPDDLLLYGPPVVLIACAGYYFYSRRQHSENRPRESVSSRQASLVKQDPWDEASGIMRLATSRNVDEGYETAKTVFVTLKGCRLEIHEANEEVPKREMFDEETPELTFNRRSTFNIFQCQVELLPVELSENYKWLIRNPIKIKLQPTSFVEEISFGADISKNSVFSRKSSSIYLFARSNRDKEAWTRRLKLAVENLDFSSAIEDPILFIRTGRPLVEPQPIYIERKTKSIWLNSLVERIFSDENIKTLIVKTLSKQVQELLDTMEWLNQFDEVVQMSVFKVNLDNMRVPKVTGVAPRYENEYGLWEEVCVRFDGQLKITLKVTLKPQPEQEGSESQSVWLTRLGSLSQYSFIKRMMENTTFFLDVNLDSLKGVLALNVPHTPTDSAWVGFRSGTKIALSGRVYWGSWPMPFLYKIINLLKEYLMKSFYKNLVIPNMVQINLPAYFN